MRHILLAALIAIGPVIAPPPRAIADDLPIPPIPPERPPPGEIAPVPDLDVHGPLIPDSTQPTVDIRQFRNRPYDPGMGFAPGSRYRSGEDRKPIQTPGVSINVPLQ
ncbi:MAG TPA: hypothetical protein VFG12_12415 [Rhodopila sp.]|jgi:hypothetical protein|nr:hypothetical protein [Rhodopila sp.]